MPLHFRFDWYQRGEDANRKGEYGDADQWREAMLHAPILPGSGNQLGAFLVLSGMRWLILLSVLALTGCGASTRAQRVEPTTPTTTTTSVTTTSTARLDEEQGSLHSSQWALESLEAGAKAVWVRNATGGCDHYHHAEVTQSPKAVTITVINRFVTGAFTCTADLRAERRRVELPGSLRGRKVLGECTPGDDTPGQRVCDAVHRAADVGREHS